MNEQDIDARDQETGEVPSETAPPMEESNKAVDVENEPQQRRWMRTAILLFAVLVALGLTLGLVFGLEDDGGTTQEDLQQQCLQDIWTFLEGSETLQSAYNAVIEATDIVCTKRSEWQPCQVEMPEHLVDTFLQVCEEQGGQPHLVNNTTTFVCQWNSTGGGMIGLDLDYYAVCAAPSCDVTAPYFSDAPQKLAAQVLEKSGGFVCATENLEGTLKLIDACQAKYQPDGIICDVNPDMCAFFTILSHKSCSEYCEGFGGSCLFMSGYKDDCEGRFGGKRILRWQGI